MQLYSSVKKYIATKIAQEEIIMFDKEEMGFKDVWGIVNEEYNSYEVKEENNELAEYQDILNEIEIDYDIEEKEFDEWDEDLTDDFFDEDF